jgi:hypothetical protein
MLAVGDEKYSHIFHYFPQLDGAIKTSKNDNHVRDAYQAPGINTDSIL